MVDPPEEVRTLFLNTNYLKIEWEKTFIYGMFVCAVDYQ